jgi:hypothetical protein
VTGSGASPANPTECFLRSTLVLLIGESSSIFRSRFLLGILNGLWEGLYLLSGLTLRGRRFRGVVGVSSFNSSSSALPGVAGTSSSTLGLRGG